MEDLEGFSAWAKNNRAVDTTVYDDSGWLDVQKDLFSKSTLGKLIGYGDKEDRKDKKYGTTEGFLGGLFEAPRTIRKDGKRYSAANKIFNDMDSKQVKEYEKEKMVPSSNPNARHLYKLGNPKTGEIKYGVAAGDVVSRYKDNPLFQDWAVLYDAPTDNADEIEATLHGSQALRTARSYDYGKSDIAPIAGTEIYSIDKLRKSKRPQFESGISKYKSEDDLKKDKTFLSKSKKILNAFDVNTTGLSDEEISQRMVEELSGFNMNMADLATIVAKMPSKGKDVAKDFVDVLDAYDFTDLNWNQAGRGAKELLFDPTTYIPGFGQEAKVAQQLSKEVIKLGLKKMAGYGALEGGAYAASDSLLKQSVQIDAHNQKGFDSVKTAEDTALGVAAGGTLGYLVQKLFGPKLKTKTVQEIVKENETDKPTKPKQTANNISQEEIAWSRKRTSEIPKKDDSLSKEEIEWQRKKPNVSADELNWQKQRRKPLTEKPKQDIDQTSKKSTPLKPNAVEKLGLKTTAKTVKRDMPKPVIEHKDILEPDFDYDAPATPKTRAEKSREIVERVEFDVENPKAKPGRALRGQVKVDDVKQPKTFDYKHGSTGRGYVVDGNLGSYQGTSASKASLKLREQPKIDAASVEVERRMKIYDARAKLIEQYGQSQTKFKGKPVLTKKQARDRRMNFEKKQYKSLLNDKTLPSYVHEQAKRALRVLRKQTGKEENPIGEQVRRAEDKFADQFTSKVSGELDSRDFNLNKEHEVYIKSLGGEQDGTFDLSTEAGIKLLHDGIQNTLDKLSFAKAIDKLEIEEKLKGKTFDYTKITDEQRKKYRNEVADIEDYIHTRNDLYKARKGLITPEQLRFRAKRRLDERYEREKLDREDAPAMTESVVRRARDKMAEEYAKIGVWARKTDLNLQTNSGKKKPDEQTLARLRKEEIAKATEINKKKMKAIADFRTYGIRHRKTSKKNDEGGQFQLDDATINYIKNGILSDKEIADMIAPIATKFDAKEAKKKARAHAAKRTNLYYAKELGISKDTKLKEPSDLVFKDNVYDAMNSMVQLVAASIGSKKLWKSFNNIREKMAEHMKKSGYKMPEVHIDGRKFRKGEAKYFKDVKSDKGEVVHKRNVKTDKELVKPSFITRGYGQGDKGAIGNLMEDNAMTRSEAEEFHSFYQKAEDELIPELKLLKDLVKQRVAKGNDPKLGWELPDGFKVNIELVKETDGTFSLKGKDIKFKVSHGTINEFSSAILPNIIHSMDAYVARRFNEVGLPTIHDAVIVPKGRSSEVKRIYKDVLHELNEKPILSGILKDIGLSDESLPERDLTRNMIEKKKSMDVEHKAKSKEKPDKRSIDLSKANTKEEVMRDFMASNSVRKTPTGQMIDALVNDAIWNTEAFSKAKENDDVFERQLAMAFQSSIYNPKFAIEAPDGVNKRVWNKVQEQIFNEFRAQLEYNVLMAKVIRGKRQYFDRAGEILGSKKRQSIAELIEREMKNDKKLKKLMTADEKRNLASIGKTLPEVKKEVSSWSATKLLTEAQTVAKKFVIELQDIEPQKITDDEIDFVMDYVNKTEARKDADVPTINKAKTQEQPNSEKIELDIDKTELTETGTAVTATKKDEYTVKTWKFLKNQFDPTEAHKEFLKFKSMTDAPEARYHFSAEELHKDLTKLLKGEDLNEWGDKVYRTNMHNVQYETEESAKEFFDKFKELYNRPDVKQSVDAMARSFGDNSKKYGAYVNNGAMMAKVLKLDPKYASILTKLASIKAMNNKPGSWEFLMKHRDSEAFKLSMEMLTTEKNIAKQLFKDNPEKFIDGYAVEPYEGYWQIVDEKIIPDAESIREQSAIASSKENAVMGSFNAEMKSKYKLTDFKNRQQAVDFAEAHNLKILDKGFFRIQQTGKMRDKAGRNTNFIEMTVNTLHNTQMKLAIREAGKEQLASINEMTSLFSAKPKDGFIKVSEDMKKNVIPLMREHLHYVNEDFVNQIFGREEVRAIRDGVDTAGANQTKKIIDRLWKDFFVHAKQSMVLKNISSLKNAMFGGVTLNLVAGVNPTDMYRHYTSVHKQMKQIRNLVTKRARLEAKGKDISKIEKELNKYPLYQMEQAGLAINQLDGVRGKSSFLYHMLSDNTGGRIDKMFGTKSIQPFLDKAMNVAMLNQGTWLGDRSANLFSYLDTQMRYTAAAKFMEKDNLSLEEAVTKANGIFSDMSQMAPAWIQAIDKYGGVLFAQWASTVLPGITKLTKNNPMKAMGITIAVYGLSVETDTNLDSVNPVTAMIDYSANTVTPNYLADVYEDGIVRPTVKNLTSWIVPGVLRDIDKVYHDVGDEYIFGSGKKTHPYNPFFKDRLKKSQRDYRGLSQKVIEKMDIANIERKLEMKIRQFINSKFKENKAMNGKENKIEEHNGDLFDLVKSTEGFKKISYDDILGFRTVGLGFNMDSEGAKEIWNTLKIKENFDKVYNKDEEISNSSSLKLFEHMWMNSIDKAKSRATELNVDYDALPKWHQYILADIVYNTGSIKHWKKVFTETEPKRVLREARRKQTSLDSRIAKIGYHFGLIHSVQEAKDIGLTETRYIR